MAYKLFNDKSNEFEAKIKLSGASLKNSFCRIVMETKDLNLMYEGSIDSSGNCKIPIKKLKDVVSEGDTGKMKLEVIAEDTYFVPWESDFEVEAARSVKVEVKDSKEKLTENKPVVTAEIVTNDKPKVKTNLTENDKKIHLRNFSKQIIKEGITLQNVRKNKNRINELSNELIFKHNISEDTRKWIVNNTLKILAKKSKK